MALREDRMTWLGGMVRVMVQVYPLVNKPSRLIVVWTKRHCLPICWQLWPVLHAWCSFKQSTSRVILQDLLASLFNFLRKNTYFLQNLIKSSQFCRLLTDKDCIAWNRRWYAGVPADAVPEARAGQLYLLHGQPRLRPRSNPCQGELQVWKQESQCFGW